jgi:hypothetical protein
MRHNRARELRTQGLAIIQLAGLQKFMIAFMILALMSLPFVQPIQKKEEAKEMEVKSAGDMMIEIHWPDKLDIDIDLWAKSPDDERPVGYSNRAGKTLNLLRDDLGKPNDSTDRNFEMFYARGLPAGEYIINIHYFISHEPVATAPEVPVEVIISSKASPNDAIGGMKEIIKRKAVLRVQKEEITVVRFVIKEDGELDPESVNDFYQELSTWQPPTQ